MTGWGRSLAATVLVILPILIVFAFVQRYFIQGISMTGLTSRCIHEML